MEKKKAIKGINFKNMEITIDDMMAEGDSWESLDPYLKDQPLFEILESFRGIKKSFLKKFGCKRFLDPNTGEAFIVIPGNIKGKTRCLVKARIKRDPKKTKIFNFSKKQGRINRI